MDQLVQQCKQFAKQDMEGNDNSHDFLHVMRVRNLAMHLAHEESATQQVNQTVVELAAILHDVKDHKYSGSLEDGACFVREFLVERGCPSDVTEHVVSIVGNLSFTKESKSIKAGTHEEYLARNSSIEFQCVQDADRLDAIGAVGIARCLTYSAAVNGSIYSLVNEDDIDQHHEIDMNDFSSAVGHYTEKLVHLKDLMKTDTGRRMAQKRHQAMKSFIESFVDECQQ